MTNGITDRHAHRHDHTDEAPRCDGCGRFQPKAQQGQNRRMCECGRPCSYWVATE